MSTSGELMARCECGVVVTGWDEDDLVANVQLHVKEAHPHVSVTRDHILAMAEPSLPDSPGESAEG